MWRVCRGLDIGCRVSRRRGIFLKILPECARGFVSTSNWAYSPATIWCNVQKDG